MNTNFLIRAFNKNSFISSYIFGKKTAKMVINFNSQYEVFRATKKLKAESRIVPFLSTWKTHERKILKKV